MRLTKKADLLIIGGGLPLKNPVRKLENKTKIFIKSIFRKSANLVFKLWEKTITVIFRTVVVEGPMAGGHLGGFKPEELEILKIS